MQLDVGNAPFLSQQKSPAYVYATIRITRKWYDWQRITAMQRVIASLFSSLINCRQTGGQLIRKMIISKGGIKCRYWYWLGAGRSRPNHPRMSTYLIINAPF